MDIIKRIYDYTTFGEHCIINKEIYQYQKNRFIQEFYCGECSDDSCGHVNDKNVMNLLYREVIRLIDYGGGHYSRVYDIKNKTICRTCFTIGLIKFHKWKVSIPFLTSDGEYFYNTIKKLREEMSHNQYLRIISSKVFQELMNVDFNVDFNILQIEGVNMNLHWSNDISIINKSNSYIVDYGNETKYLEQISKYITGITKTNFIKEIDRPKFRHEWNNEFSKLIKNL